MAINPISCTYRTYKYSYVARAPVLVDLKKPRITAL